jgi:serine/threonine protein kinase
VSEPRDIKSALRSLGDALRADFAASESRLGPYRLLHLVGEGAVAEVFAACREGDADPQNDSGLRYAVKVVKPDLAGIADVLARFERERVLLAGLSHECIVRVIDEGTTADGRPWLAMPLVEGNPITVAADELALPLAARIALVARVSDAVAAAHDAGVIHRDLKPANILLERGADGAAPLPRVIDFGVARALAGTHTRLTPHSTAHRLGTPDYMPPEQWEYGIGACEKSSDVYALGIVLGELACGTLPRAERADAAKRRPGAAIAPSEALRALAARDAARAADAARLRGFPSADALIAELKRSVDPVFARATAQKPESRYADARGLCDALRAAT